MCTNLSTGVFFFFFNQLYPTAIRMSTVKLNVLITVQMTRGFTRYTTAAGKNSAQTQAFKEGLLFDSYNTAN